MLFTAKPQLVFRTKTTKWYVLTITGFNTKEKRDKDRSSKSLFLSNFNINFSFQICSSKQEGEYLHLNQDYWTSQIIINQKYARDSLLQ